MGHLPSRAVTLLTPQVPSAQRPANHRRGVPISAIFPSSRSHTIPSSRDHPWTHHHAHPRLQSPMSQVQRPVHPKNRHPPRRHHSDLPLLRTRHRADPRRRPPDRLAGPDSPSPAQSGTRLHLRPRRHTPPYPRLPDHGKGRPLTFVPSSPDALYSVIIYHQPLRIPNTSFREPRRDPPDPHVRYVYAAEMDPFDPTLANPSRRENRQLRALLANEASRLTGLEMRNARSPWPITPPGTIMRTPLAPATQP